MFKTVEAALRELDAMEQDMLAEGMEANYSDLVETLLFNVAPKLRAKVARRALGYLPAWVE